MNMKKVIFTASQSFPATITGAKTLQRNQGWACLKLVNLLPKKDLFFQFEPAGVAGFLPLFTIVKSF